ncbi:MAG TPA: 2'-5' RNA ligase family protein, partial [Thermoplasmata archaeon]|nr:2'-5' RNA ligase family protein [Thermoplasmata archaeon]
MRTFVAIEVPGATRAVGGPSGPAPEHLTLRFLGEVEEARVPQISTALAEAAARSAPFVLALAGVGGFPDLTRPRIVYAEVSEGRAEVVRLAAEVEAALQRIG